MERDNLKKPRRIREGVDVKFGFIAKHRGIWPVEVQCGALGVSQSGFDAWGRRAPSRRAMTDAAIVQTLRTAFALSDSTYGVRRILDDVRDAGHAWPARVRRATRAAAGAETRPQSSGGSTPAS